MSSENCSQVSQLNLKVCTRELLSGAKFEGLERFRSTTWNSLPLPTEEQQHRRLYNRSAGLLEVSSRGQVQFIHQTAKSYMSEGEGSIMIKDSLATNLLESGPHLVTRLFLVMRPRRRAF